MPFALPRANRRVSGFLLLALALGLATGVRAFYVLQASFPLNDGGLFYVMALDLQTAGYRLPATTAYNGEDIPFAYPPAAMYLAALLEEATPLTLETLFLLLPLVGCVLSVVAFWLLAEAMLGRRAALVATTVFGLLPSSFAWLLMGGGLPRSFGLALAILAMREAYVLVVRGPSQRHTLSLGLLAGATLLTHLETAVILAVSVLLIGLLRPRAAAIRLTPAALLAIAVSAPWWATVLSRHGLDPFIAARSNGGRILDDGWTHPQRLVELFRDPVFTGEPYFPIIAALGLVGAAATLVRGQWLLVTWWAVVAILGMRAFPTFLSVPGSLLAGAGALMLFDALRSSELAGATRRLQLACAGVGGAVFALMLYNALAPDRGPATSYLRELPGEDRAAMAWVRAETSAEAAFVVVPLRAWHGDYPAEWFPALAQRHSLVTPQGSEWVRGAFGHKVGIHRALEPCGRQDVACVERAVAGNQFDYIYVPARCCRLLKESLHREQGWDVVFENGALIARRAIPEPVPEDAVRDSDIPSHSRLPRQLP